MKWGGAILLLCPLWSWGCELHILRALTALQAAEPGWQARPVNEAQTFERTRLRLQQVLQPDGLGAAMSYDACALLPAQGAPMLLERIRFKGSGIPQDYQRALTRSAQQPGVSWSSLQEGDALWLFSSVPDQPALRRRAWQQMRPLLLQR